MPPQTAPTADESGPKSEETTELNEDIVPPTEVDEEPSSFSRVPLPPTTEEPPASVKRSSKKGSKKEDGGDPVDQDAVARANLAAAPLVGVVGYGPGTGGGSGIRRHTPSCDFCKRRKERCIGGPPCQTCANRSIPCTFQTVNKSHFDRKRVKHRTPTDPGKQHDESAPQHDDEILSPAAPESNDAATPATAGPSSPTAEKPPRKFKKRGTVSEVACTFCRDRRKKCSAERPTCNNCHRRGLECTYTDTPRNRKGGRKRKPAPSISDETGQDGSPAQAGPSIANISISHLPAMPGMLMPMPFLSPSPCHFCRDQELPCDRLFPGCTHCHRRSQQCFYDPFTPDITQLGLWPQTMPIPTLHLPTPPPPLHANQASSSSLPQLALHPTVMPPFFDMNWMAQWAELTAQGHLAHPPGPDGKGGMIYPQQFYDPTAFGVTQPQSAAAAVAQSEPVIERAVPGASNGGNGGNGDVEMADQLVDDADGEDEDLDLDELDGPGEDEG